MPEVLELIVAAFDDEKKAQEALEHLKMIEKKQDIQISNAAILSKNAKGKFFIQETQDVDERHGAAFGAITGGLIGLLGGPAGAIVGAAAGAAAGGLAAGKMDMGFDDDILGQFSHDLKPSSSAIIALVRHEWIEQIITALEDLKADVFHQLLQEDVSHQIKTNLMNKRSSSQD